VQHSFDVGVALKYGTDCAVILTSIKFWIQKNKANGRHFNEGYYWTYNSNEAFQTLFPYMTKDKIRRSLERMEKDGAIITSTKNKMPFDRTKWYAITEYGMSLFSEKDLTNVENLHLASTPNAFGAHAKSDLASTPNAFGAHARPIPDIYTDINQIHKQQTPQPIHTEQEQQPPKTEVVVVSEPPKKSTRKTNPTPDISCLSFIAELPDTDKLSILKATGNDVPNIQQAYAMAKSQGGVNSLTGFIIDMAAKFQRGEVTPPIKVKRQTVNRFVNFQQRDIDFKELERLELEQLKEGMEKDKEQEAFVNCFEEIQ